MWSPAQYQRYAGERNRPFLELLSRIQGQPRRVVDLGCGDGRLTAVLHERWPDAQVLGIDSSPEMLAAAEAHAIPGRLTFALGDIGGWRADDPVDLLFSNAALQWVAGHATLLPSLVAALAPGGTFAFQIPGNHAEP